ncbi:DNA polymerase subunit Cdc27 [Stachybotrys elegans]|uniref:DNA polymerase delta subunit 3 n=1 Tax=Stachybotrys elegans TaxID=80388 RepID=A0A8K0WVQ2_9HYPO|nr:DNA polymerase subunit Cdc27 [Stachybotrys elegans]
MDEYKKYLADRLLSEEQPITYRLLSRALNIHVNTAKEVLYDFHKQQNSVQAGSIHATYIVYGTRSAGSASQAGDVEMAGSAADSEAEEVPCKTLTLVNEDNLKAVLSGYDEVTSIHIYSLAPHPSRDLALLSDVAQSVFAYTSKEDLMASSKTYGTISNPQVRRREPRNRRAIAAPPAAKSKSSTVAAATTPKSTPPTTVKKEGTKPASKPSAPASSLGKNAGKSGMSSVKRGVSGGIMQSFAKAATKPPPASKAEATAALSDDGEADDMDIEPSTKTAADGEAARKSLKDREAGLRRMMEEEEEAEDSEKENDEEDAADEAMEDAPEPDAIPEPEQKQEPEETQIVSSSGNGRRRGKRRVMKKERKLDDQGYMVTIQTQGWESFSEDEAPPPAKKATPSSTPSSSAGSKAKKPAGKGGQGSIMSFFAKK